MEETVETTQPDLTPEEARIQFFEDLKTQFPSAPTQADVDRWKAQSGRVRVAPFNDDEIYFFRAIKNAEYKGMVQQAQSSQDPDQFLKELVVSRCILWPKMDTGQMANTYAGTIDALYSMIMQASNFLTQREVTLLVREL